MENTNRKIAKNAAFLMVSQVATWAFTLLTTIVMARYLGPAAIGKYQIASSMWAILVIIIGFGSETLLIKEIARSPAKVGDLFGSVAVLRTGLFILGFSILALYARLAGYSSEIIYITYIIGIVHFVALIAGIFSASLQGLERMEYISISAILAKFFVTVVTLVLIYLKQGLLVIVTVPIGANLIILVIQFFALRHFQKISFHVNWEKFRWVFKSSFPYLASSVFLVAYQQVDVLVLSRLVNEQNIGWYSAAVHFNGTLLFLPVIFVVAVFPSLSRMHAEASDMLPKLVNRSFNLMLLLGVPIGFGIFVIARPLMVLLYGPEFANSGPVLAILGLSTLLIYENVLLGQYLISTDRQNVWTAVMAVATLITIPLDIALVPWCNKTFGNAAIAGALTFFVTEAGMVMIGLRLLPKGMLSWANMRIAARTILAGLIMVGVTLLVRNYFVIIPILVGAVVYLGSILMFGVVTAEDIELIKSLGQSILVRLRRQKTPVKGMDSTPMSG